MCWFCSHEQVNVVRHNFQSQQLTRVVFANALQNIFQNNNDFAFENVLTVFWNPDKMIVNVKLAMNARLNSSNLGLYLVFFWIKMFVSHFSKPHETPDFSRVYLGERHLPPQASPGYFTITPNKEHIYLNPKEPFILLSRCPFMPILLPTLVLALHNSVEVKRPLPKRYRPLPANLAPVCDMASCLENLTLLLLLFFINNNRLIYYLRLSFFAWAAISAFCFTIATISLIAFVGKRCIEPKKVKTIDSIMLLEIDL